MSISISYLHTLSTVVYVYVWLVCSVMGRIPYLTVRQGKFLYVFFSRGYYGVF